MTLRRLTDAHGARSSLDTAIEGFTLLRSERASEPSDRIFKPALCIVAQGAKWTMLGRTRFEYPAGKALVVSVEMPSRGAISVASSTKPFLGAVIEFDLAIMQSVIEQLGAELDAGEVEQRRGAFVTDLNDPLTDCVLRSLRLLDTPKAIPMLYPGIMRELCYWLLTGPNGAHFMRIVRPSRGDRGVISSIHHLRDHFAEPVRVDALAAIAQTSPGTLHRHFKAVTSMTPLQYQKQIRLLEARRLMIAANSNAEAAAIKVGYESPSQFSRDYTRMFGKPPRRDISAMRLAVACTSDSEKDLG